MIGGNDFPLTQQSPCKECDYRLYFARAMDMHFDGEDCWLVCEKYEKWKESKKHGKERN